MNCSHCQTRNPIGSRFCRQCGTELAPPVGTLAEEEARQVEAERAREQAAELLARGHRHFERGEVDTAIPLAEEAARLLPESTAAHSLRATLYEAARRTDDALAAQQRVVELNPDSAVDRDKLDRMRRGVHFVPRIETAKAESEERRWIPWVAAAAAGIAALWIGFAVSRPKPERNVAAVPAPNPAPVAPTPTPAWNPVSPTGTAPLRSALANPAPTNDNVADPFERRVSPPTPAPPTPDPAANPASGAAGSTPLPPLQPGASPIVPVPPVVVSPVPPAQRRGSISAFPPGDAPRETVPAGPPTPGANSVGGTNASGGGTTPAAPPRGDQGYIRIQINPPKSAPPDPAPERGGPREDAGDPLLKAQTLQAAGKWREAIAWFRNAEFAGADPGDCHQGMALCHQRLADWDNARASYRKAIAAFEKHRNTPRWRIAERSWSACKAALEVLGG